MRALVWHGTRDVRVDNVPDPKLQESTDAIIRVTTSGLCGSDLHLYEILTPFLEAGDVLGHEPMGIVEEVGSDVKHIKPGDRVVVPFNISCGECYMCKRGLQSQCETTQVRSQGCGAALFGFSKLYGQVPGGQAQYLRIPQAHYGPIKVPEGPADDRFVYLSDVLPTAWQAVEFAEIPEAGTVAIFGLGPIGQMAARIALYRGARVIGIDRVPERLELARKRGVEVINTDEVDDAPSAVRELTDGRGPDSVIEAVGMEAHGSPVIKAVQKAAKLLPDPLERKFMKTAGMDSLAALYDCIETVRRGGTLSIVGVYGGNADPLPMMTLFDKQVHIRMGQANVRRWTDKILPLLLDGDPLNVDDFASHHVSLEEAPGAYEAFQKKTHGAFKILFKP